MVRIRMFFFNFKADILKSYVEAVSLLVPDKNLESEPPGTLMNLFIELKDEFVDSRKDIYSKVDGTSRLICPTFYTIQTEEHRQPITHSLQQVIINAELKSNVSTYASVAQTP
ncbi:hypothetical protein AVEN_228141-1 [Araneus ventricosus]|uniref:Uncharacterized protein n=1 Tax=Araneus ventricosus TaxID=182803 RepID=A0A4Y2CUZ6_ARAVE|nr:hypothetical protein AVEN_228141-1 [Araneus ventricosus]